MLSQWGYTGHLPEYFNLLAEAPAGSQIIFEGWYLQVG